MQARLARSFRSPIIRGARLHTSTKLGSRRAGLYSLLGAGGVIGGGLLLPPIYADVLEKGDIPGAVVTPESKSVKAPTVSTGKDELDVITWGWNKCVPPP